MNQKKVGVLMVQKKRGADKNPAAAKQGKQKIKPKMKAKAATNERHPIFYEIIGVILIGFTIITFFELGMFGEMVRTISMFFFGNLHYSVSIIAIVIAAVLLFKRKGMQLEQRTVIGMLLILVSFTIFSHSILFEQ